MSASDTPTFQTAPCGHLKSALHYIVKEKTIRCYECELTALREQLAAAEKDAERYRWLRKADEGIEFRDGKGAWRADGLNNELLDTAIDAARKEGK